MNETELTTQSVFDTIEERKETPVIFGWTVNPDDLVYDSSEILYESALLTTDEKGVQNSDKYILTLRGLYKCKVSYIFRIDRKREESDGVFADGQSTG